MKAKRKLPEFLKIATRDIFKTGTLLPSSRWACRTIAAAVPASAQVLVEYGSGDGKLTESLLERLPPSAKVLAIEQNGDFLESLRGIADPRLEVLEGDVVAWLPKLKERFPEGVDAIVSGIPFSLIPFESGEKILRLSEVLLKKEGRFVAYQNSLGILSRLRRHFRRVSWSFEPRNILPYFIFVAGS